MTRRKSYFEWIYYFAMNLIPISYIFVRITNTSEQAVKPIVIVCFTYMPMFYIFGSKPIYYDRWLYLHFIHTQSWILMAFMSYENFIHLNFHPVDNDSQYQDKLNRLCLHQNR